MTDSYLLSAEQVAFRNAALVKNLLFKFPQIANYPHEKIVEAYNEWFMTADSTRSENEADFLPILDELMSES